MMSDTSVPTDPTAGSPETSSSKLLWTLGTAGALAGVLIVTAHQMTEPRIEAYKAMKLREAVSEVLGAPDHWDTLYVIDDRLTTSVPAGVDERDLEKIFLGYRQDGTRIGFAISGSEPGFQDVVELIFGYDPETKRVLGMKVLTSKETPGLGDKIVSDESFGKEFQGPRAPLVGVKSGRATGADNEVDMITGATISSRTVIGIINHRLERVAPMLEGFLQETD
jgi:electron transport complex protein RnfG